LKLQRHIVKRKIIIQEQADKTATNIRFAAMLADGTAIGNQTTFS
jgi:hypothetical protein